MGLHAHRAVAGWMKMPVSSSSTEGRMSRSPTADCPINLRFLRSMRSGNPATRARPAAMHGSSRRRLPGFARSGDHLARRPATRWTITSKTGLSAYSRAIFPIRRRLTHLMQEQTSPSHLDPLILLIADDLAITMRSAWESSCRPRFVIPT